MKKVASILILVVAFAFNAQAQKKGNKKEHDGERGPKLTVEQHTDLAVKKMTLVLDLTDKQQEQIKPLINAQAASKKAEMLKRKENRDAKKKPTSDEIYAMKSAHLDHQIAFKAKMKEILNKEQFEKFEKMKKNRKGKGKKMMMMKKHKKNKEAKEHKE